MPPGVYTHSANPINARLNWGVKVSESTRVAVIQKGLRLGRVCKLQPHDNCSKHQHCQIVLRPFFISGCDSSKLLESINRALNSIALPINLTAKRTCTTLIAPVWNRHPNSPAPQVATNFVTAVGFVAHHLLRTNLRTPNPGRLTADHGP